MSRIPPTPMTRYDILVKQALEGKLLLRGRRRKLRIALDALASKFHFEDDPLWKVTAPNGSFPVSLFIRAPSRAVLQAEIRKMDENALLLDLENVRIVLWVDHWPWLTTLNLLLHAQAELEG